MAEPKQKQHRSASRVRRGKQKASAVILTICSKCQARIPAHIACPECGYYRDKEIIKQ